MILPTMTELAVRLQQSDNRCTATPIFLVEKKERFYGVDMDYADKTAWLHIDGDEVTDEAEIERLESLEDSDPDYYKVGYLDRWVYVQPFLSEQGARDYIAANKHRYEPDELRVYVDSGYRNYEWQALRLHVAMTPTPGSRVLTSES